MLDLVSKVWPKFHEEHGDRPNWYLPRGHFCPEANAIVAAEIAEFVNKNQ